MPSKRCQKRIREDGQKSRIQDDWNPCDVQYVYSYNIKSRAFDHIGVYGVHQLEVEQTGARFLDNNNQIKIDGAGPTYVREKLAARVDVHGSMSEVMDHGRVVIRQRHDRTAKSLGSFIMDRP